MYTYTEQKNSHTVNSSYANNRHTHCVSHEGGNSMVELNSEVYGKTAIVKLLYF